MKPARKRELVTALQQQGISERRACRLLRLSRSANRYEKRRSQEDTTIAQSLRELAEKHRRWGLKKMFHRLRAQGHRWNRKRVHRIYRQLGLHIRVKPKKRLPSREPVPLLVPERPNVCWSLDFMSDSLIDGRRIRTLNVMDDFNREVLGIEVGIHLPAIKVRWFLDQLAQDRGYPQRIRVDNGPEFLAQVLRNWAQAVGVQIDYIQPGKPAQNAYIERLNRTYREDVLDAYWFSSVEEVQAYTDDWLLEYNQQRPHEALNNLTPIQYRERRAYG